MSTLLVVEKGSVSFYKANTVPDAKAETNNFDSIDIGSVIHSEIDSESSGDEYNTPQNLEEAFQKICKLAVDEMLLARVDSYNTLDVLTTIMHISEERVRMFDVMMQERLISLKIPLQVDKDWVIACDNLVNYLLQDQCSDPKSPFEPKAWQRMLQCVKARYEATNDFAKYEEQKQKLDSLMEHKKRVALEAKHPHLKITKC